MADVSKIFKPRRGKKSTMAGTKKTTVLSNGEMFIEVPDTGSGTGHSRMKIGDGSTAYSNLPYAMGDTENDEIAFSSNTSTTVATALNSVTSGGKLKNLIAGLKQAVSLCSTSITKLNDDMSSINNTLSNHNHDSRYYTETEVDNKISNTVSDIYVGDDGKLHKVIGGADTVLPFSSDLSYEIIHNDSKSLSDYIFEKDYKFVLIFAYGYARNDDSNAQAKVSFTCIYSGGTIVEIYAKNTASKYNTGSCASWLLHNVKNGETLSVTTSVTYYGANGRRTIVIGLY